MFELTQRVATEATVPMAMASNDARLALDRWTGHPTPGAAAATVARAPATVARTSIKSLAEGRLLLWTGFSFKAVDCCIGTDVHGVWCLLGPSANLRVPLASICMVVIVSVSKLQFKVVRFGA